MVLTKGLKEFFLPAPVKCLKEIHTLLPIIAREKNGALLRELSRSGGRLSDLTLPPTLPPESTLRCGAARQNPSG